MADVEEVTREDTPLLSESAKDAHDAVYRRFTPAQKRTILLLVSWAGLVPCAYYSLGCASTRLMRCRPPKVLVSGSFIPAIPQIVADLHSTPETVRCVWLRLLHDACLNSPFCLSSYAISISILTNAFGNLIWATYAGFCASFLRSRRFT
jgi:hypothetical protein